MSLSFLIYKMEFMIPTLWGYPPNQRRFYTEAFDTRLYVGLLNRCWLLGERDEKMVPSGNLSRVELATCGSEVPGRGGGISGEPPT